MPWLKFVLSVFLTCCIISSSTSSLYIAIGELYCLLASFCFPTWETQNQTLLLEISIPSWVFNSPPIQHSDWRNWHFTKMFRLRRARNLLTQCIGDTFTFHCYFADKIAYFLRYQIWRSLRCSESGVQWRSNFQIGSRVLKKFFCVSMAYNVISCIEIIRNSQTAKIADFTM